jgi:hypothetical protein
VRVCVCVCVCVCVQGQEWAPIQKQTILYVQYTLRSKIYLMW